MEATESDGKRSWNTQTAHDLAHIFSREIIMVWRRQFTTCTSENIREKEHEFNSLNTNYISSQMCTQCSSANGFVAMFFWFLLHKKNTLQTKYLWILLPAFIHYAQSKDIIIIGENTSTIYALQTIYSGFFLIKSIECAFIEFFGLWVSNLAVEMLIRDFLFGSNNVGLRGVVLSWNVIKNLGKGSITPIAAYSHNLAKSITHCYHVEHIFMIQIYIWLYGWHLPRWLITSLTLLTPTCVTYFYAVDQMKSVNSKAFHLTSEIIGKNWNCSLEKPDGK